MLTIIGATNIDILATTLAEYRSHESNPSHIIMGVGGSGKNIAHNISLLGEKIQYISLFGDDYFGEICRTECQRLGLDIRHSAIPKHSRCSLFTCINTPKGELRAAASDMRIMEYLTPEFIESKMDVINQSEAVVVESSVPAKTIACLMDNCIVPLYGHTTDAKSASVFYEALQKAHTPHLMALVMNETATANIFANDPTLKDLTTPDQISPILADMGVHYTYITLSSHGVYCYSAGMGQKGVTFPAMPIDHIVDTNGAGDAFTAGVVFGHLRKVTFPDTAYYGLHAAKATLEVNSMVNPMLAEVFKPLLSHKEAFVTQDNHLITMHISGSEDSPF